MRYNLLNGSDLAYIGDAYIELIVRRYLIEQNKYTTDELMKQCIKYVSANSHVIIYEQIKDEITVEEMDYFRRGKNTKYNSKRKNLDKKAHSISTGLEAVIGYLYLSNNTTRLDYLMSLIIKIGDTL